MTVDYGKKKVDELTTLLKARGLAHNGKKAELVARLVADDEQRAAAVQQTGSTTATAAEDEIDWEEDTPMTTTKPTVSTSESAPAPAPAAAASAAAGNEIEAVPSEAAAINPSQTPNLEAAGTENATSAPTEESTKPPVDFSTGLLATDLDAELAKRKARAARFGIAETDASNDALKALERAKRFGTSSADQGAASTTTGVRGLDDALPERRERKRNGDRRGGRRFHGRGSGRNGRPGDSGYRVQKRGRPTFASEQDKLAAEARKQRFAGAPSTM